MKQNESVQRALIILGLVLLVVVSFFIRNHNFKVTSGRSTDEVLYYRMAFQIQGGLENYNTIPCVEMLRKSGRRIREYLLNPLYKHPPMFTLFLSLVMRLFGFSEFTAFYVPVFFSLMMIPLVYCLGKLVYNRTVGFISAFLITFDPMSIICSQKLWMESTLAFFTVLSIYAFVKAFKTGTPRLYISSGILSGLGALTKYTGGISTLIFTVYAYLFEKKLFKNKYFLISVTIPFIMLIPWFYWNLSVYGWAEFLGIQSQMHSSAKHAPFLLRGLFIFACGCAFFFLLPKKKNISKFILQKNLYFKIILGIILAAVFHKSILRSFNITYLPITSWSGKTFYFSSRTFYIDRLLQFSLIYFFGFMGLFFSFKKRSPEEQLLRVGSVTILLFFTIWGAFQSRYIIALNPLLILIGTNLLVLFFIRARSLNSVMFRLFCQSAILILVVLILIKVFFINKFISFPNDLCYF